MGADGGVGWVVLRDGKTAADLRVLLRPWWDSLTYVGGGDFAEESREEFIRGRSSLGITGSRMPYTEATALTRIAHRLRTLI